MAEVPALPAPETPLANAATGIRHLGATWQLRLKRTRALAPATMAAMLLVPFAAVLDLTSPGRDVVTSTFEGATVSTAGVIEYIQFASLVVSLTLCSFVVWVTARLAVVTAFGGRVEAWPQSTGPRLWILLRDRYHLHWYLWMPRLLAAAPFAIIVVPLFLTREIDNAVRIVVLVLLASLVAVLMVRHRRSNRSLDEPPYAAATAVRALRVTALAGFAVTLVIVMFPVTVPRALGSPAVGLLAVAFIIATLASLYRLVQFDAESAISRTGDGTEASSGKVRFLPLLFALLIAAFVFSLFNDNHRINGRADAIAGPAAGRPTLEDAVAAWAGQLPAAPPGAKIPIFFVATAGGASRAAYWTGVVLAKLEADSAGDFGRHVFAVSSVSGGTLGAAAYLAERAEGTAPAALARRMKAVNGADHLAPAIASLLFPDLLQRLLPLPLLPDRAEALERSFEASWVVPVDRACRNGHVGNRFARPFLELWRCAAPGAWVPMLLSNGTRAEDGRRIVTTNLALAPGLLRDALDFHDLNGTDVPLSVVVTNSARFPLVSPPGTLPARSHGESSGHIIDGGYFENGGISSLSELAATVIPLAEAQVGKGRLIPIFIEINNDDTGDPAARYRQSISPMPTTPDTAVGRTPGFDALLPLLGLYNTRSARGTQEALRVRAQWNIVYPGHYRLFQLCPVWRGDRAYATQMNWTLSRRTQLGLDHAFDNGVLDPGCGWRTEAASVNAAARTP